MIQVVIVSYGPPGDLNAALEALRGSYPVVVVDNSSREDTRAAVEAAGARYVDPGANVGFAAAVNIALRSVDLEHTDVLLLNPDAQIGPADVERLHVALHEERSVACAAPSHRAPGSSEVRDPFWPWDTPAGAWAEALGLHRLRNRGHYLSGAVLMVAGSALAHLGGLDERFFLYCEDEDWQRRASQGGWSLSYCPDATAVHRSGGTETNIDRLALRLHCAMERYVRKWYGTGGWAAYRSAILLGQLGRWVVFSASRRRPATRRSAARLLRIYLEGPERAALKRAAVPARVARNPSAGPDG